MEYSAAVQAIRLSVLFLIRETAIEAQSRANDLAAILGKPLETPDVVSFQLRQYLYQRLPRLPSPASAQQWLAESRRLRKHLADDVIFHRWPREWVDAPPKFENLGVIESGHGYRMRKLLYEIVPGFRSTAILYEPERVEGKSPAVLNDIGHEYEIGNAAVYKQKRCINRALHGMFALSAEWLGCGELNSPENRHPAFPLLAWRSATDSTRHLNWRNAKEIRGYHREPLRIVI